MGRSVGHSGRLPSPAWRVCPSKCSGTRSPCRPPAPLWPAGQKALGDSCSPCTHSAHTFLGTRSPRWTASPPKKAKHLLQEAGKDSEANTQELHPLPPPPQDEYEELDIIHKEEKVQLEELRQRYQVLVEEFAQIRAEREVNAKKNTEAEQEMLRMVRAATLIQAVWKGYLVRSVLRSRKKRSKSKGRGKKGKEKGKGKGRK